MLASLALLAGCQVDGAAPAVRTLEGTPAVSIDREEPEPELCDGVDSDGDGLDAVHRIGTRAAGWGPWTDSTDLAAALTSGGEVRICSGDWDLAGVPTLGKPVQITGGDAGVRLLGGLRFEHAGGSISNIAIDGEHVQEGLVLVDAPVALVAVQIRNAAGTGIAVNGDDFTWRAWEAVTIDGSTDGLPSTMDRGLVVEAADATLEVAGLQVRGLAPGGVGVEVVDTSCSPWDATPSRLSFTGVLDLRGVLGGVGVHADGCGSVDLSQANVIVPDGHALESTYGTILATDVDIEGALASGGRITCFDCRVVVDTDAGAAFTSEGYLLVAGGDVFFGGGTDLRVEATHLASVSHGDLELRDLRITGSFTDVPLDIGSEGSMRLERVDLLGLQESVVAQLAPTGTLNLVGSSAQGVAVSVVGPAREVLASFEDGSIIDASCGASTCVEGE
ncbi:MAG: hypothetical protein H6737_01900 [Alphaproteobacteria bacterium]|nr:hypothetical protein [Alphaproteobacteria bacterium]